jgi:hypothetical protein
MDEVPKGRLDTAVVGTLARRAVSHPLVTKWAYAPNARSPRSLVIELDATAHPTAVTDARLDVRWFDNDDYTFHYIETHDNEHWQCRWDRHPKAGIPDEHFHPPPDASDVETSELSPTHHLDALFSVLDWVSEQVATLYENG